MDLRMVTRYHSDSSCGLQSTLLSNGLSSKLSLMELRGFEPLAS